MDVKNIFFAFNNFIKTKIDSVYLLAFCNKLEIGRFLPKYVSYAYHSKQINKNFQHGFKNRSISARLEPVQNHTEKSCIVSYCRQLSMNINLTSIL